MDLKEIGCEGVNELKLLKWDALTRSSKHGNECLGSIKHG